MAFCSSFTDCLGKVDTNAVLSWVCVWLVGAIIGYLLPRPKATGAAPSSLLVSLFSGSEIRRLLLAFHGLVIIREVWYHFTCPGTFRRLSRSVLNLVTGKGWDFEFPSAEAPASVSSHALPSPAEELQKPTEDNWYVTEKDLAFFKHHGLGSGELPGASKWELMMEKEIPNVIKYISYRRTLPGGKTEYKSITVAPDASAEESSDMYFDDDFRPQWDSMIADHSVLESGDFSQRQQVVHWVRRFPFSFITDRVYIIARRRFADENYVYGVTKSLDSHPRAPAEGKIVKVDVFYSMWGIRNVECPWGSGKPACETTLLHHEQLKVPENLGRFTVRHAMWGFVKNLTKAVPCFVVMRRQRAGSFEIDKTAYGFGAEPNPPSEGQADTCASSFSMSSRAPSGTVSDGDVGVSDSATTMVAGVSRPLTRKQRSSSVKGLAAFAIASGMAMLLKRSNSANLEGVSAVRTGASEGGRSQEAAATRHRRHRQRYVSFESL